MTKESLLAKPELTESLSDSFPLLPLRERFSGLVAGLAFKWSTHLLPQLGIKLLDPLTGVSVVVSL